MIIRAYFILALIIAGTFIMNGQETRAPGSYEKVILFSDRNLYVTGETILFSASIQTRDPQNQNMSRILYCELITSDATKITGGKYLISNFLSSGSLVIPPDILTGNYYLRSYTKYMRNVGPDCYSYTTIKIVNPNREEVQATSWGDHQTETRYEIEPVADDGVFRITSGKSQYLRSEIIDIMIEKTADSSIKNLSIAVVPEHSLTLNKITADFSRNQDNKILYQKENLGLSLTGKLIDNITRKTIKDSRINLSIIGRGRDFMSAKTDSAGEFYFSLPDYTGSRDLFLCAESYGKTDHQILVDNDFCSVPFHIPAEPFKLTPPEREAVLKMAVNCEVGSYFSSDSINEKDTLDYRAFYGKPDEILYIDKYVQLPTLEEYFNALTATVRIRKKQGEKYIRILSHQTGLTEFEPLVMVDLVVIENLDGILALNPQNILKIEVVNALYVKGDETYGGIVNIISRNNDFAGINLPSSGIFINYSFLTPGDNKYRLPGSPDTRNTLYWDPHLSLDTNNVAKINFHSPDTPGKYIIVLNGVNSKGQIFRQTSTFEVKGKIPFIPDH